MIELTLQGCIVKVWSPVYMETHFPNGGFVPALFQFDEQARQTARDAGYADDDAGVALMHFEHDLAHAYLAEWHGLPYSPVLFRVAGGPEVDPELRAHEEGAVLAFQRAQNMLQAAWGATPFRRRFNRADVLARLQSDAGRHTVAR